MVGKKRYRFVMIFVFLKSFMLFVCNYSNAMGVCLGEKAKLDLQDAQLNLRMAKEFIVQNQFLKAFVYLNLAVILSPEVTSEARHQMKTWYEEAQKYLQQSANHMTHDVLIKNNIWLLKAAASQDIDKETKQHALSQLELGHLLIKY